MCLYIKHVYFNFNNFSLETFGSIKCIVIDRISLSVDIIFSLRNNKQNRNKHISISLGFVNFSYRNVSLYVDNQAFT